MNVTCRFGLAQYRLSNGGARMNHRLKKQILTAALILVGFAVIMVILGQMG